MNSGRSAVLVEIAVVVHGLLESLILPSEDVITMSSSTAE